MNIVKERIPTLRETVYRSRLRDLEALVVVRPGHVRKVAILSTRYGSVDIQFDEATGRVDTPPGVAHFLEHQLFKKQDGDALMNFGKWGASSNAFTDYSSTTYYFVSSENYPDCLRELFRLVLFPDFAPDRVEREKSIIEQEILMYEDMPDVRATRGLLQALYRTHPVRIDIAGSAQTIRSITPELLYRCYRNFYNPTNMTLVMAGDLDPRGTLALASELMEEVQTVSRPIGRVRHQEPPGVETKRAMIEFAVSRPRVLIGFKDSIDQDSPARCLVRDVETAVVLDLLFGRSSTFFSKHYATGLIDEEFGASYSTAQTFGFSIVAAETDRVEEFEHAVSDRVRRLDRFASRDVQRIKRKIMGRFLRSFDSAEHAAFTMLECEQKRTTFEQVLRTVRSLTPERLGRRAREHLDAANSAVSVVYPKGHRAAPFHKT